MLVRCLKQWPRLNGIFDGNCAILGRNARFVSLLKFRCDDGNPQLCGKVDDCGGCVYPMLRLSDDPAAGFGSPRRGSEAATVIDPAEFASVGANRPLMEAMLDLGSRRYPRRWPDSPPLTVINPYEARYLLP